MVMNLHGPNWILPPLTFFLYRFPIFVIFSSAPLMLLFVSSSSAVCHFFVFVFLLFVLFCVCLFVFNSRFLPVSLFFGFVGQDIILKYSSCSHMSENVS